MPSLKAQRLSHTVWGHASDSAQRQVSDAKSASEVRVNLCYHDDSCAIALRPLLRPRYCLALYWNVLDILHKGEYLMLNLLMSQPQHLLPR